MRSFLIILFLILSIVVSGQRLIVLTDPNILTTKETDDAMSLVRLMVYSNEFEIEGLIATCSHNYGYRHVEPIYTAINAYEQSLSNLRVHASGYPDPDELRAVTALGPRLYGTEFALNESPISPGAELIINSINKNDDRPIWIQIWGDGAVIAQALEHIRKTQGSSAAQNAALKLRILDMAGQDDSGAWLMAQNHYPDMFYIRWINEFCAMDPYSDIQLSFYPWCGECAKGEGDFTTDQWVANNIQNHGPLGDVYPNRKYLKEGDTPTLLYMIPNGLNDPEKPWMGSWGGRMTRELVEGIRSVNHPLGNYDEYTETEFDPYYMTGIAEDTWNGYTSTYASIFRWWPEFQNDFAARMDWSINSQYQNANHPPIIDQEILYINAFKGDVLSLPTDAIDPDGDLLNYDWWYYKEAGTYPGNVIINNTTLNIPQDSENTEIHVVLSVSDNGSPSLTRYKRVIISVFETFIDDVPPSVPRYLERVY